MVNGTMEEVNCNSCAEKQMLIYKGYKTKTMQGRDKGQNGDNEKLLRVR